MACDWWDLECKAGEVASSAIGDAIDNMAAAVVEAYGKAVASVGTGRQSQCEWPKVAESAV